MDLTAWIPGAACTLVGAGLVMWRQSAITDTKLAALEKRLEGSIKSSEGFDHDMTVDLKEAFRDLREVSAAFRSMAAEQSVINKVTSAALEGVVLKLDMHLSRLNEHGANISLIRELMKREERDRP